MKSFQSKGSQAKKKYIAKIQKLNMARFSKISMASCPKNSASRAEESQARAKSDLSREELSSGASLLPSHFDKLETAKKHFMNVINYSHSCNSIA